MLSCVGAGWSRSARISTIRRSAWLPSWAELAAAMEAGGQLTLAEARDLLGTSRRYAQALLEHMDSEGMTLRVGDARRLRRRQR